MRKSIRQYVEICERLKRPWILHCYIYIVLFGPVKPELGVIPSGQENHSKTWTFKFSW